MSKQRKIVGKIYSIEHIIEYPIDKLIFGKSRYDYDSWFWRCMGSRFLWMRDLFGFAYFSLLLESGTWDHKEWKEFVSDHNELLWDIVHCEIYNDMGKLNSKEFKGLHYDAEDFVKYQIPNNIPPSKENLKRWLIH